MKFSISFLHGYACSHLFILAGMFLVLAASFLWMKDVRVMVDERVHSRQIGLFLSGETTVHEQLTQIPGYHVVMAAAAYVFASNRGRSCDGLPSFLQSPASFNCISALRRWTASIQSFAFCSVRCFPCSCLSIISSTLMLHRCCSSCSHSTVSSSASTLLADLQASASLPAAEQHRMDVLHSSIHSRR